MEKYERKATVAFDPGRRQVDGISVAVKFPPAVFRKLIQVKAMSHASDLKATIRAALDKHVETLRLVQEGYRIFAAPEDFTAENTVAISPGRITSSPYAFSTHGCGSRFPSSARPIRLPGSAACMRRINPVRRISGCERHWSASSRTSRHCCTYPAIPWGPPLTVWDSES